MPQIPIFCGAGGTVKRPTRVDGPAMVFRNIKGHPGASVAIGLMASRERVAKLFSRADHVYPETDYAAVIASGSFVTDGMIVLPCSMKTLAGIVNGYAENLLLRAADVCLKEGRRLVLVPRETPLGKLHLRNLSAAAELGCVIVPPVLTFYNRPQTVEDQINHVIGKVLLQFGIVPDSFHPWEGAERA